MRNFDAVYKAKMQDLWIEKVFKDLPYRRFEYKNIWN